MKIRMLEPGEKAPDFTLPTIDGHTLSLAGVPLPSAFVFMRHLA